MGIRAFLKHYRMKQLYRRFIQKGDLVFDLGANRGERTAFFRELGARVIAVEPHPRMAQNLAVRFKGDPMVTLYSKAVGKEKGTAVLFLSNYPELSTLNTELKSTFEQTQSHDVIYPSQEKVTVTTLDEMISTHGQPAFCKIDVEGHEAEVLQGSSTPLKAFSFEFLPQFRSSSENCFAQLNGYPYRFQFSPYESFRLAFQHWLTLEETLHYFHSQHFTKPGDFYALLVD